MQLASSTADGAYYASIAVYLLVFLDFPAIQIAAVLAAAALAGFFGGIGFGFAADLVRTRWLLVSLTLGSALAMLAYAFVSTIPAFAAVAALHRVCQKGAASIRGAALPRIVGETERVPVRGQLQAIYNLGLAAGALGASLAIVADTRLGFQILFAAAAAIQVMAAWPASRLRLPEGLAIELAKKASFLGGSVLSDGRFLSVFALHAIMLLNVPIIDLVLPFWVLSFTNAPSFMVPVVFALNTVGAIVFQAAIARRVTSAHAAIRTYRTAGVVLMLAFWAFALAGLTDVVWLACAFLILGACVQIVGEMMQLSAGWHVSYALAPANKHGQYQGVFLQGMTVAEILGPLLQTVAISEGGAFGWFAFGAVFMIAGFCIAPLVRRAEAAPPA
jgi:MFS family permease